MRIPEFCIYKSFQHVCPVKDSELLAVLGHDGYGLKDESIFKEDTLNVDDDNIYKYTSFSVNEIVVAYYALGVNFVTIDDPKYFERFLTRYNRFVAFKGSHCIGVNMGRVLDTMQKYTSENFLDFKPEMIALL